MVPFIPRLSSRPVPRMTACEISGHPKAIFHQLTVLSLASLLIANRPDGSLIRHFPHAGFWPISRLTRHTSTFPSRPTIDSLRVDSAFRCLRSTPTRDAVDKRKRPGQAVTQVIQGEKLFDLVVRMQPQFRSSAHEIGELLVGTPDGKQIPLSQLAEIKVGNGASFIYRENNSRYIGVQYSIEGRDLERAVRDGQKAVDLALALPQGYTLNWGGEYSQFLEARAQLTLIGPIAVVIIFTILFALYGNFKFPVTIALGVILIDPVGALIALKLTHTPFSVSSVLGLLALLGVSVETAVILVSYINKLRQEGMDIRTATREASLLRLRPIMMTALVACLGLLPAALATGIGSDTQKPFAIVIVAGLISRLFIGFFVNPVLYQMVAREGDVLQV